MNTAKRQVALLGPQFSFHHLAAISKFGDNLLPVFSAGFKEIIDSVISGDSEYGILAVHNSNAGYVGNNFSLIAESGLYVTGEIKLQIHFYLAAKQHIPIADITSIASHPVGLQQCAAFLQKFPHARLIETSSTSQAAEWIAQSDDIYAAALAGKQSIADNRLIILEEATSSDNIFTTRFLVLQKTLADKDQSPDSELYIAVVGLQDEIQRSIQATALSISELIPLNGEGMCYIELFGNNISECLSYIYTIEAIKPQIRLIGYFPKCEIIVNT